MSLVRIRQRLQALYRRIDGPILLISPTALRTIARKAKRRNAAVGQGGLQMLRGRAVPKSTCTGARAQFV